MNNYGKKEARPGCVMLIRDDKFGGLYFTLGCEFKKGGPETAGRNVVAQGY